MKTKPKTNGQKLESESTINRVGHMPGVIENEIECPRCYDLMTLCSDFDNLYYICENCDFYMYTIKK